MKLPLDRPICCFVALPRPGGSTTIYRGTDVEPTLDVVGVSSTDVHNFEAVIPTFHTLGMSHVGTKVRKL